MTSRNQTPIEAPRPSLGWIALFGGPVLWAIHLGVRYPLVDVACAEGSEWPLHAVSIVCGLANVLVIVIAITTHRRARRATGARPGIADEPDDPVTGTPARRRLFRIGFLARAGMVTSSVFLLAILAEAATTIAFDPCTRALIE